MREKITISIRGRVEPSPVREGSFIIEPIDHLPGTFLHLYPDRAWKNVYRGLCIIHTIYPDQTHQLGFCVGEMIPYEMPPEELVQKQLDRFVYAFPKLEFSIIHYHGTRYGDYAAIVANQNELVKVIGTIPAEYHLPPINLRNPDEFDWSNLHCDEETHNSIPQPTCGPLTARLNEFRILSSPIYLTCRKKNKW